MVARILGALLVSAAVTTASAGESSLPAGERRLLEQMAASGTNAAMLYALADFCHDEGVAGDKRAVLRAEEYLHDLLELEATNAPALALLGSVQTLKARDTFWPTRQLRLVREGNRLMDRAVDLAPDDPRTRAIRALNNAHMPAFLGREEIVRADLEWLWAKVQEAPDQFSLSAKQNIALHWGRRLERDDRHEEARAVWEAGVRFGPESDTAAEIAAEIQKLR